MKPLLMSAGGDMEPLLIVGRWHPELEDALLSSIEDEKSRDPLKPVVVVVGSVTLSNYLKLKIAEKIGSNAGISLLLLIDLARRLASKTLAEDGRLPFPGLAGIPLVRGVVESIPDLRYFQSIKGKKGFHRALASTFDDLAESGLIASSKFPSMGGLKWKELVSLYRRYLDRKEGFYDPSDAYSKAIGCTPLFEEIFGSRSLYLYGFYDFTELQRKLIAALITNTDLTVFFPFEDSREYEYAAEARAWFGSLGFREKACKKRERIFEVAKAGLMPGRSEDGAVKVSVMNAPGRWREVREIARFLLMCAEKESIPFSDMAVLLRDSGSYIDLFMQCFDEVKIPYNISDGIPLSRTRTGRSILLLMELLSSDFPRPLFSSFLSLAPIDFAQRFGVKLQSPMEMDVASREAGVVQGCEQWMEKLILMQKSLLAALREAEEAEEDSSGGIKRIRGRLNACRLLLSIVDRLKELRREFERISSWRELKDFCLEVTDTLFSETPETERIRAAVEELDRLDGLVAGLDPRSCCEMLADLFASNSVRAELASRNGVLICDLMAARGVGASVVVIPGLIEGIFPSRVRQDPILLDRERDEIRASLGAGPFFLRPKWTRILEEKLLFKLATDSAARRLILSYPRIDPESSKPMLPSYLLIDFLEQSTGLKIAVEELDNLEVLDRIPLSWAPRASEGCFLTPSEYDIHNLCKSKENMDPGRISYLFALSGSFRRALNQLKGRWGKRTFTRYDGVLRRDALSQEARNMLEISGKLVSPRRLEKYARCPFAYFVGEVLDLSPLEEPEEEATIDAQRRGRLYHMLLEVLVPIVKDLHDGGSGEIAGKASRILEEELTRFKAREATGLPLLWELEKEDVREEVSKYVEMLIGELDEWSPLHFEERFGIGKAQPLEYTTEGGQKLYLRGIVDRMDTSEKSSAFRIIDYKTGRVMAKDNDFGKGESLQLAFYLLAGSYLFSLGEIEEGAAFYQYITTRGRHRRVALYGSAWEKLRPSFDAILETITSGIRNGLFFPYPDGREKKCSYCDARGMCLGSVLPIFERKRGDSRAAPFLTMKEAEGLK